MTRNSRRAYDAEGREIAPMPLSNMREHGVRSLEAIWEATSTKPSWIEQWDGAASVVPRRWRACD